MDSSNKDIQYLIGTIDLGIMYTDEYDVELVGFSDSNGVGNPDDKRSTSSYVFNIGSGIVSWSSKK